MNRALRALLRRRCGVIRRADAVRVVDHDILDRAVSAGQLLRPYPMVLMDPSLAGDRQVLARAAVVYADGRAALSHLTGLRLWGLPVPDGDRIHLTSPADRRLRGARGLVVHRRDDLVMSAPQVVWRAGLPVLRLEQCIVDSWPLTDGDQRRAPAIVAVGQRLTTPERIREAVEAYPRLGGRRLLVGLLDLLDAGCRSELELWGYTAVFRGLGLRWQAPVRLGSRTVYLDTFDESTRVNFELDGAKYHVGPVSRERDLRRDAALAALGITVVRFTHERLHSQPDSVRRQVCRILAARRR